MKYRIIYADPPWMYYTHNDSKNPTRENNNVEGTPTKHYQTLSIDEMKSLPIGSLADDNCVLFLWCTSPKLSEGLELMKAWQFTYKTIAFVWIKTTKSGYYSGLGFHTNSNVEFVLLGKKGRVDRLRKDVKQLVFAQRTKHSEKPNQVRIRIEQLYGNLPRIELFARIKPHGWDVWGNDPKLQQEPIDVFVN